MTGVGIVIEVNELHSEKAYSPITETDVGIVIDVNEKHPEKAQSPIFVTYVGISNCSS